MVQNAQKLVLLRNKEILFTNKALSVDLTYIYIYLYESLRRQTRVTKLSSTYDIKFMKEGRTCQEEVQFP